MHYRIAIIGGGPIGLEAALAARASGYDPTVYEQGRIGAAVKRWGHVCMFSPFAMNVSEAGLQVLRELKLPLPAADAYLTGNEYAHAYVEPLGRHLRVKEGIRVRAISRATAGKRDSIGEPARARSPFRLLVEEGGEERFETAEIIFDCSGTFGTPNPLGEGGIPAIREAAFLAHIRYGLADLNDLTRYAEKRVLVAGGGHSAATVVRDLARLKEIRPGTHITWLAKKPGSLPAPRIPGDPLPQRDALSVEVNALVAEGAVEFHGGATVLALDFHAAGIHVSYQDGNGPGTRLVDEIIAATGYRPDLDIARELHVQNCWATEGTYPLAAKLLGETGGNCLAVPAFGAETLLHPEPNYYVLGMKSYGRTPDFLIQTGREQVTSVLAFMKSKTL